MSCVNSSRDISSNVEQASNLLFAEVKGIRRRGRPKQTRWDCVKNYMESLGLFQKDQKDAQFRNKWRRRIKGATR